MKLLKVICFLFFLHYIRRIFQMYMAVKVSNLEMTKKKAQEDEKSIDAEFKIVP